MRKLLQMGSLTYHYLHHIYCEKEAIGIVEFIRLHYFKTAHLAEDQSGHENLPFQHNQQDQQSIAAQFFCVPIVVFTTNMIFQNTEILSNRLMTKPQLLRSSPALGDIWPPPKVS